MTETELAIVTAASTKIHFFTASQAARTWWDESRSGRTAADRILADLVRKGFLWTAAVEAHPEVMLKRPLWSWSLGDKSPPYASLVRDAKRRFRDPDAALTVYLATRAAALTFGGKAHTLKRASTTHDLHLAAVYLALVRSDPARAARWVSEDELAPERVDQVLPDAALLREDGSLELVIEFVGTSYSAERLRNIHLDCEARDAPYELW